MLDEAVRGDVHAIITGPLAVGGHVLGPPRLGPGVRVCKHRSGLGLRVVAARRLLLGQQVRPTDHTLLVLWSVFHGRFVSVGGLR